MYRRTSQLSGVSHVHTVQGRWIISGRLLKIYPHCGLHKRIIIRIEFPMNQRFYHLWTKMTCFFIHPSTLSGYACMLSTPMGSFAIRQQVITVLRNWRVEILPRNPGRSVLSKDEGTIYVCLSVSSYPAISLNTGFIDSSLSYHLGCWQVGYALQGLA